MQPTFPYAAIAADCPAYHPALACAHDLNAASFSTRACPSLVSSPLRVNIDLDKAHEHPAQRSWSGLDVGELAHKPMPARSPAGDRPTPRRLGPASRRCRQSWPRSKTRSLSGLRPSGSDRFMAELLRGEQSGGPADAAVVASARGVGAKISLSSRQADAGPVTVTVRPSLSLICNVRRDIQTKKGNRVKRLLC